MRIASFNLQRLRMRRQDGITRMDGARDADTPEEESGPTPEIDHQDRRLTAKVIRAIDADCYAFQEVFDRASLDYFHDAFLLPSGARPWPWRECIEGNDGHSFDVALMSRLPLQDVASHAALTCGELGLEPLPGHGPDEPVFRRDCLRASIGPLTVYACHFKAPYPDEERAWFLRRREAQAVRMLVERDMAGRDDPLWLVLGDLNEPAHGDAGQGCRRGAALASGKQGNPPRPVCQNGENGGETGIRTLGTT